MTPARQAEQCLTTEIWTPALDGRLPVIVWVPGGSYRIGGASLPTYDGSRLASESTVVVGCNYRLGALGWLAADGVPTNLGLRDLAAAVAWVRDVAPAFGGDPDRIVLMGESAGAGALAHLLATEAVDAAGAILQSGAPAGTLDEPLAEWVAGQFFDAAGADGVDALRHLPIDAVLEAQERTVNAALGKVGMMPFHPWVDGDLLTAPAFRAALAPLPLVVSTTANEMELFRDQVPVLPEDIALRFLAPKAATLGITDESSVRAGLQRLQWRPGRSHRRSRPPRAERADGARPPGSRPTRVALHASTGKLRTWARVTRSIFPSTSEPSTSPDGATSQVHTIRVPTTSRPGCVRRGVRSRLLVSHPTR